MSTKTSINKPRPTHLIDPILYAQVIELENIKSAQKSLKAKEDELKEAITAKMYDIVMVEGVAKVLVDYCPDLHDVAPPKQPAREITLSFAERKTLSREKLMEHGVSPEIIGKSTEVSEYTVLRHKKVEERDNGN